MDKMLDQIYFTDAQSSFIRNSRSPRHLDLANPINVVGKTDLDLFSQAVRFCTEQEVITLESRSADLEPGDWGQITVNRGFHGEASLPIDNQSIIH